LEGGNGSQRKAFILPATGPQTKRADWIEYELPGAFSGFPQVDNVTDSLPDAIEMKILRLHGQGFSDYAIAKEVFNNTGGSAYKTIADTIAKLSPQKVN